MLPSPPAPLPRCGRGEIWVVTFLSRLRHRGAGLPALRERGDLGREWGIVDSRRRRIAIAPLMPPPSARLVGAEGGWGEGKGVPSPLLSRSVGTEGGRGEGEGAKAQARPPAR